VNWTADHAGFVASAYAVSALGIAGLLAYVIGRDRKSRRALKRDDKHKP
jgi:heme exporter protein CcmD